MYAEADEEFIMANLNNYEKFNESIKNFIEKYLNILTLLTAILLILIFIFVKYYF